MTSLPHFALHPSQGGRFCSLEAPEAKCSIVDPFCLPSLFYHAFEVSGPLNPPLVLQSLNKKPQVCLFAQPMFPRS